SGNSVGNFKKSRRFISVVPIRKLERRVWRNRLDVPRQRWSLLAGPLTKCRQSAKRRWTSRRESIRLSKESETLNAFPRIPAHHQQTRCRWISRRGTCRRDTLEESAEPRDGSAEGLFSVFPAVSVVESDHIMQFGR